MKPFAIEGSQFKGYTANTYLVPPQFLSPPSKNCLVGFDGQITARLGFEDTGWNLTVSNRGATSWYIQTYDITFFALGTKLLVVDHAQQNAVYDTGITLTDNTTSRFADYAGNLFLTNTTDGLRQIILGRTNGAASSGAGTVTIDIDESARLSDFAYTTGNLRINGTNEAYSQPTTASVSGAANNGAGLIRITTAGSQTIQTGQQVVIAGVTGTTEANGTWTVTRVDATHFDLQGSTFSNAYVSGGTWTVSPNGLMVLSGTLSQNYADRSLVLVTADISSGREKASKLFFWHERMGLIGSLSALNSHMPNYTVFFGKFTIGDTSVSTLSDIINFSYGTGGSWRMAVGKGGWIKNAVATQDYLYTFKEVETYLTGNADITLSGTSIGSTVCHVRDRNHGCLNEDCAADTGDGDIVYLTSDKRIMRIRISTELGAPVIFPDESFDTDIRFLLPRIDDVQSAALVFYYKGKKQCIFQLSIDGVMTTLIYDKMIQAWQPPQYGKAFKSYFERKGVLYGCGLGDGKVYRIDSTNTDNGAAIDINVSFGPFDVGNAMVKTLEIEGSITAPTVMNVEVPVNLGTAVPKVIKGSNYSYDAVQPVGGLKDGDPVGGPASPVSAVANFKKNFDIFPQEANKVSVKTFALGDSFYYALRRFNLSGMKYSQPFTPQS